MKARRLRLPDDLDEKLIAFAAKHKMSCNESVLYSLTKTFSDEENPAEKKLVAIQGVLDEKI